MPFLAVSMTCFAINANLDTAFSLKESAQGAMSQCAESCRSIQINALACIHEWA